MFLNYISTKNGKKLLMNEFYIQQRIRLNILVEKQKPVGGRWSFDQDNRKKLPKSIIIPERQSEFESKHYRDVTELISKYFPTNPGQILNQSWLPVNHQQAEEYLNQFVEKFLPAFGDYEDAITASSDTVFHSCLSALLNSGFSLSSQKSFTSRMTRILKSQFEVDSLELEEEIDVPEEEDVPPEFDTSAGGINIDDFSNMAGEEL